MGDHADDMMFKALAIESSTAFECERILDDYKLGILKWKTRDGDKILVSKMEVSHIQNCIKMLTKSKSDIADTWIHVFNYELIKREA